MTSRELLDRYWRIPVVGLLAGVLAFAASFLVSPNYESSTRLLVHGRDATFLTSSGKDLSAQPGVVDASLSQALLSTYAGIATGRSVSSAVVTKLQLDQQPPSTSFFAPVTGAVGWVVRCGRAFITSGFCAAVNPTEQAIADVQEGITAKPVGTNEGSSAGQSGSYVLEVSASAHTPAQAKAITDAVADELVGLSNQRFKRDADAHAAGLQAQVDKARQEVSAKTKLVSDFQTRHNISSADAKQTLSATTYETLRTDLINARADLSATRAQLGSVERSLAGIPRQSTSTQKIRTGRSETESTTSQTSTVYNDLLGQQAKLRSEEAGGTARVAKLQAQLKGAKPAVKNGPLGELTLLQQEADIASLNLRDLTTSLQQATTTAAQGSVDLSRLDTADEPTYPAAPKRYVYLALGLLLGALGGAALTIYGQGTPRPRRTMPPAPKSPLTATPSSPPTALIPALDDTDSVFQQIFANASRADGSFADERPYRDRGRSR